MGHVGFHLGVEGHGELQFFALEKQEGAGLHIHDHPDHIHGVFEHLFHIEGGGRQGAADLFDAPQFPVPLVNRRRKIVALHGKGQRVGHPSHQFPAILEKVMPWPSHRQQPPDLPFHAQRRNHTRATALGAQKPAFDSMFELLEIAHHLQGILPNHPLEDRAPERKTGAAGNPVRIRRHDIENHEVTGPILTEG